MAVDINEVKRLKELTGVGITDAKKALEESGGDFDKALEAMRVKGLAKADKKAEREVRSGLIDAYVHGGRIGVVVEVNCETDFVARTDDFKEFAHNIAMHIAASSPRCVAKEDLPAEYVDKERKLQTDEVKQQGKPDNMLEQIVNGKMEKFYDEVCLMRQPYIKDPDQTVEEYTKSMVAKLGENIVIRNFSRIELGGSN